MYSEGADGDQILLATGGYDHTIKLWQTHTGICQRVMQHSESQVNALEITPDRKFVAAASYQHIHMYDLMSANSTPVINFEGTSKNVTDVGFQEDGKWMYSGGEDGRARIWDLKTKGSQCPNKAFDAQSPITCVCLHPINQVELFVGDQLGIIHRWDLKTDHNEQFIPDGDSMILDVAIDPLGEYMAAVNSKGKCYVWELHYGNLDEPTRMRPKHKFDAHNRQALKCIFSPDSKMLATTSADQSLKLWSMEDYQLIKVLKEDSQRWVWDAAFSADSQYIFSASSDSNVRLWNISTGKVEREYAGHQRAVTALAFRDVIIST